MERSTRLRLFGGAVLMFNLWAGGRYGIEGIPLILMTFGFAAAYEVIVVRPRESVTAPLARGEIELEHSSESYETTARQNAEPQLSPEEEMRLLGVTVDGNKYRYESYTYDRLDDALRYARIQRSRTYKCK